jgi:hypothetical protein
MKTLLLLCTFFSLGLSFEIPEFGTISFPDGYTYKEPNWVDDTIAINDTNPILGTWYISHFYSVSNDSLSMLFTDSIMSYELSFDLKGRISGSDGCYSFEGSYALSESKRILIPSSGSNSKYCVKEEMNQLYQQFSRFIVHYLHESRYEVRSDTLLLKNSLGFVRLLRK